jgi:hypothetical protein
MLYVLVLVVSCAQPGAEAVPEKAYIEINSAEDLGKIGKSYPMNAVYQIPQGTPDITLADWEPIGTADQPFTGSFTGNETTVIRVTGFANAPVIGLFGYVKGSAAKKAEIKNLKVEAALSGTLTMNADTVQYAGALVGYGEEIAVTGSSVSGTIRIEKTTSHTLYAGGLVGCLKNGTITGSASSASMELQGQAGICSGGILGCAGGTLTLSGCTASGNLSAKAGAHNSSAGGVVGSILGTDSTLSACAASGELSLTPLDGGGSFMFYCGGVVGYAGNGTADTSAAPAGAVIEKSRYTGSRVYCENAYPYAGGVIGYNYTGSIVRECYAGEAAVITAQGSCLPYAGGVAGYISGAAQVLNSYSRARVEARSTSKQALAGGIAGATAKPSLLSKCYATGAVSAQIDGSSTAGMGGSLGVPAAANAGGISGSLYYENPKVEKSVALNSSVTGKDTDTGGRGTLKVYRVGGLSDQDEGAPTMEDNRAWVAMPVSGGAAADRGPNKQDGQDCAAKPDQSDYVGQGWNFATVWKMGEDGYPMFRYSEQKE